MRHERSTATRIAIAAMAGILGLLAVAASEAQVAATVDPHALYEARCYSCHTEHAADFARLRLTIKADKLTVARTGKDLGSILKSHHRVKLDPSELAALSQLFRNGIAWGGVFQHRCASCHGKAVEFARNKLTLQGEKLVAKDGRDVTALLATHGEATAKEIGVLVEMFKYQLATAPKP